jgi:hypothetical protein
MDFLRLRCVSEGQNQSAGRWTYSAAELGRLMSCPLAVSSRGEHISSSLLDMVSAGEGEGAVR